LDLERGLTDGTKANNEHLPSEFDMLFVRWRVWAEVRQAVRQPRRIRRVETGCRGTATLKKGHAAAGGIDSKVNSMRMWLCFSLCFDSAWHVPMARRCGVHAGYRKNASAQWATHSATMLRG
jgi:hypothetical protein